MPKIHSMTGYGSGERDNGEFSLAIEIKSVNHRFKDVKLKIPSLFSSIEIELKKKVGSFFSRGSFDLFLNYKKINQDETFEHLDTEKISQFLEKMKKISAEANTPLAIDPCQFLRAEFLKDQKLKENKELFSLVGPSIAEALAILKKSREEEGEKLKKFILDHLALYEKNLTFIIKNTDLFQAETEDKLKKRFAAFSPNKLKIDETRFLQEVVYYMEKLDIHEETNRIQAHLTKLKKIILDGGPIGREIDFLVQELNRETNTIGSKSNNQQISETVVQMKVQIEKMREQSLNLE